jgi:hypothetical protein
MRPYVVNRPRSRISGPRQHCGEAVQPLEWCFTNWTKREIWGIAAPQGTIELTWTDGREGPLVVWREVGGARAGTFPRGFGTLMITAAIVDQLGGTVEFQWAPAGMPVNSRLR